MLVGGWPVAPAKETYSNASNVRSMQCIGMVDLECIPIEIVQLGITFNPDDGLLRQSSIEKGRRLLFQTIGQQQRMLC